MITKYDLEENRDKLSQFVMNAIFEHKLTTEYRIAEKAREYYLKHNPDIDAVNRVIYDMKGLAHMDDVRPNHKLKNGYYPDIINGSVSHLLANGVLFSNEDTKTAVGNKFDSTLRKILKDAKNSGVSYGFYDNSKKELIHFPYREIVPILDDYTGELVAAIRWYQIDTEKPLTAILYEIDGYTEFVKEVTEKGDGQLQQVSEKKSYNSVVYKTAAEGVIGEQGQNYGKLPIIPLYNIEKQSEIVGNLEIIIAIDLVNSQLINNVSESDLVYWVLKNYGGMGNDDAQKFVTQLIKSHVINVDDDGSAEPHQINVPVDANAEASARLKRMLYDNMSGVDTETLKAGNLTATAIKTAYSKLRQQSADLEFEIIDFVEKYLELLGIEDTMHLTYFELTNATEDIQNILSAAQYLSQKAVTRKIATLLGIIDELPQIEEETAAENMTMTAPTIDMNENEE